MAASRMGAGLPAAESSHAPEEAPPRNCGRCCSWEKTVSSFEVCPPTSEGSAAASSHGVCRGWIGAGGRLPGAHRGPSPAPGFLGAERPADCQPRAGAIRWVSWLRSRLLGFILRPVRKTSGDAGPGARRREEGPGSICRQRSARPRA